jgi:hypothetical protein
MLHISPAARPQRPPHLQRTQSNWYRGVPWLRVLRPIADGVYVKHASNRMLKTAPPFSSTPPDPTGCRCLCDCCARAHQGEPQHGQKSRNAAMSARYNIAHSDIGASAGPWACSRSAKNRTLVPRDKPPAVTRYANVTWAAAGRCGGAAVDTFTIASNC